MNYFIKNRTKSNSGIQETTKMGTLQQSIIHVLAKYGRYEAAFKSKNETWQPSAAKAGIDE